MFAQEFCFYNFKRYSIKTNTFHYNSLLPLQRIADTWMSVKVPYDRCQKMGIKRCTPNDCFTKPLLNEPSLCRNLLLNDAECSSLSPSRKRSSPTRLTIPSLHKMTSQLRSGDQPSVTFSVTKRSGPAHRKMETHLYANVWGDMTT